MPNLAKVSSTVEASSIETISDLSLLSILWESEQAVLKHWRDWLIMYIIGDVVTKRLNDRAFPIRL